MGSILITYYLADTLSEAAVSILYNIMEKHMPLVLKDLVGHGPLTLPSIYTDLRITPKSITMRVPDSLRIEIMHYLDSILECRNILHVTASLSSEQ